MNQYPRPEVSKDEQQRIGKMMMKILSTKGVKALITAATSLGIENARLVAEVNEHREARGFEKLPVFDVK